MQASDLDPPLARHEIGGAQGALGLVEGQGEGRMLRDLAAGLRGERVGPRRNARRELAVVRIEADHERGVRLEGEPAEPVPREELARIDGQGALQVDEGTPRERVLLPTRARRHGQERAVGASRVER